MLISLIHPELSAANSATVTLLRHKSPYKLFDMKIRVYIFFSSNILGIRPTSLFMGMHTKFIVLFFVGAFIWHFGVCFVGSHRKWHNEMTVDTRHCLWQWLLSVLFGGARKAREQMAFSALQTDTHVCFVWMVHCLCVVCGAQSVVSCLGTLTSVGVLV